MNLKLFGRLLLFALLLSFIPYALGWRLLLTVYAWALIIGFVVYVYLRGKEKARMAASAVPPESPSSCPYCGAQYFASQYRPSATEWLCSDCRGVLPHPAPIAAAS